MRLLPIVLSAGTVVLAAGAYALGAVGGGEDTSTPQRGAPPQPPSTAGEPALASTPTAAGQAWLQHRHTWSWTDPSPTSWAERTRALTTGEARADLDRAAEGPDLDDWQATRAQHCRAELIEPSVVIPPEAPRTSDWAAVQAAGTVRTHCGDRETEQPVAVTLATRRTGETWRVEQQLF